VAGRRQRYYAPWRPDPRLTSGLLQGTYAYLRGVGRPGIDVDQTHRPGTTTSGSIDVLDICTRSG
jgi:HEXXH motif-containing protein